MPTSIEETLPTKFQEIIARLISKYRPEKVILFGSYASRDTHQWSDLDLVLVKKTKSRFYDRIGETFKILRPIEGKPPLDIIVYTPEEFKRVAKESLFVKEEIIKKGKILYE